MDVLHTGTSLKVRSEVIHTCPKYSSDFMDEPFRFPITPKTFKPALVNDHEWHNYKHKMARSQLCYAWVWSIRIGLISS